MVDDVVMKGEYPFGQPVIAHELMGWTPPGGIDVP